MKQIILLSVLIGIIFVMGSCSNDNNLLGSVTYYGVVNNANTGKPFPNVTISVTNGHEIRVSTKTNAYGDFSITVNVSELSSGFYILVGDDYTNTKRFELTGISKNEVDLGVINLKPASEPELSNFNVKTDGTYIELDAIVTTDNFSTIKEVGICYSTNNNPTINDYIIIASLVGTSISGKINEIELNAGTDYYFRAYATNNIGVGYSNVTKFQTKDTTPKISWYPYKYDYVTPESIIDLKATVDDDGGYDIVECGFCYSATNTNPKVEDTKVIASKEKYNRTFEASIYDISSSTKYFVRPYAINSRTCIAYGNVLQIETLSGLATIELSEAYYYLGNIHTNSTIKDYGGADVVKSGISYSTKTNPSINDNVIYGDPGMYGFYSCMIPITKFDITYYIKSFAETKYGLSYSTEKQVVVPSN